MFWGVSMDRSFSTFQILDIATGSQIVLKNFKISMIRCLKLQV